MSSSIPNLKSYEPDLEVTVGSGDGDDNTRSFMYHGAILANASEYIDTMLSTSMKEQETRSISFPDIEPEEWLKWTRYVLEPVGAAEMSPFDEDSVDVLRFYDKYQFRSGIRMFDFKLSETMVALSTGYSNSTDEVTDLIMMICKDGIDLPLSTSKIPKFISSYHIDLTSQNSKLSDEDVKVLLPFCLEKTLVDIVDIAKGSSVVGRSLEELKSIAQEESFVARVRSKVKENDRNRKILSHLKVGEIRVGGNGRNVEMIQGTYYQRERKMFCNEYGVMNKWYSMRRDDQVFIVQAMDGLGLTWTISTHNGTEYERIGVNARRLYKWHKGTNISSFLPPENGWQDVVEATADYSNIDSNDDGDGNVIIDYSLER